MSWMVWKGLLPPVAVPLIVSAAVALAGPGGPFGLTPDGAGEQPRSFVSDVDPADSHRSSHGDSRRGSDSSPAPSAEKTPAPVSTSDRTPPGVVTVPLPTEPAPAPASPGPTQAPPAATPTPLPGPLNADDACSLVSAYVQAAISSVTVEIKSCSAEQIAGAWAVHIRIRHPGCAPLDALGLPCVQSPLKLNFYIYEADRSIVPADDETALIIQTY